MTDVQDDSPTADSTDGPYMVGIGASAGGLEAIEAFFAKIPAKSGAAYIVVQHLSPDFKSLMDQLLARRTTLAIRRAEEGMVVNADCIYLIPPRTYMRVRDGRLHLSSQEKDRSIPLPIDVFFRSLAKDAKHRAVGVILSGTGSDGSRGIQAIKAEGGVVMVQDTESAKFDGMPISAIATGVADVVTPATEMAAMLLAYMSSPASKLTDDPTGSSVEPLRDILDAIRIDTGIDFSQYKQSTLHRRLNRRMGIVQVDDIVGYRNLIRDSKEELNRFVQDLLIGVTEFFRDTDAFNRLEQEIPALVKMADGEPMRIWIAGCSTGEEAYSIAILLDEYRRHEDASLEFKIFATDVNQAAISRASEGVYPAGIAETLSRQRLEDYFDPTTIGFRIRRAIRDRVVFAQHNLVKDPPFTRIHLATCRNLLIYIRPDGQSRILHNLHFSLLPKGVLFLGPSEGPMGLEEEFLELDSRLKLFRKRRDVRLALTPGRDAAANQAGLRLRKAIAPVRTYLDLDRVAASFLSEFVPTCLVLEEDGTIVHTFGDARELLTLPIGRATLNAISMMSQEARTCVTTGMNQARKEGKTIRYRDICIRQKDQESRADLTVKYLPPGRDTEPALFLVMVGDPKVAEPTVTKELKLESESSSQLDLVEQELKHTKESLQSTIEELQTTNEELQSTNEELLASNEELQSTNEELHSVNEELYTVNTEHQKKIEELTELTSDIENLLRSIDVGTIFLDRDLCIRKFTPQAERAVKLVDSDLGRPIEHLSSTIEGVDPWEMGKEVLRTGEEVATRAADKQGRPLLVRALPYVQYGVVEGIVITVIDIQSATEGLSPSAVNERSFRELLEHLGETCWLTTPDGSDVVYVSPSFTELWGIPADELYEDGHRWLDAVHPEDREEVLERFQSTLGSGEYDVEYRVLTPQRKQRRIRAVGLPIRDERGEVIQIAGFFREVAD